VDIHYLDIAGQKFPACFSMAATEDIVAAFGGMDEMSKGLLNKDISVVGKMLDILISAGCEYCDLMGMEHPKKPKGRLTALMSIKETEAIVGQIFDVMTEDAGRTVEVRSKNA
jgi:hypothetical protein